MITITSPSHVTLYIYVWRQHREKTANATLTSSNATLSEAVSTLTAENTTMKTQLDIVSSRLVDTTERLGIVEADLARSTKELTELDLSHR
jgi:hypothetical protein